MKEISKEITEDLKLILEVLDESDSEAILQLKDELSDNWQKKQIFRTEVEMRISVLNDAKHPTEHSKYWQCVREMSAMFDALMGLSFDLRRNEVKRLKLERKLDKIQASGDSLKLMGDLVVHRGDTAEYFLTSKIQREPTPTNLREVSKLPIESLFYIFPSWVKHHVVPNQSNQERVSIAFNFISPNQK